MQPYQKNYNYKNHDNVNEDFIDSDVDYNEDFDVDYRNKKEPDWSKCNNRNEVLKFLDKEIELYSKEDKDKEEAELMDLFIKNKININNN